MAGPGSWERRRGGNAVSGTRRATQLVEAFPRIPRRTHGGHHCGRSAIALNDRCAVEPDHYYYRAALDECTIEGSYFQGVPQLIAEVLSPATRALDRGPRMDVYRRAGVPHLWLLDPETEIVEEFALAGREFSRPANMVPARAFGRLCFPRNWSPWRRSLIHRKSATQTSAFDEPSPNRYHLGSCLPINGWGWKSCFSLVIRKSVTKYGTIGAPCLLAFGSSEEAELRFGNFLEEICRWEQTSVSRPSQSNLARSLPKSAAFSSPAGEGTFGSTSPSMHSSIASS